MTVASFLIWRFPASRFFRFSDCSGAFSDLLTAAVYFSSCVVCSSLLGRILNLISLVRESYVYLQGVLFKEEQCRCRPDVHYYFWFLSPSNHLMTFWRLWAQDQSVNGACRDICRTPKVPVDAKPKPSIPAFCGRILWKVRIRRCVLICRSARLESESCGSPSEIWRCCRIVLLQEEEVPCRSSVMRLENLSESWDVDRTPVCLWTESSSSILRCLYTSRTGPKPMYE